jgi:hypothetical protein
MEANLPTVQQRSFGITPRGIEEAIRLAKIMAASGLMPKSIETPEAVFVAMQMGAEIGLSPMASVQNIAVINGRPGIYGDAALAIVRSSGLLEEFKEWSEGERKKPDWTYFCRVKRKGCEAVTGSYSWAEALEAGFDQVKPESPWKRWTNRMMQFKARNFAMRDQFADFLKGIRTIEENSDAIVLESTVGNDGHEQYQLKASAETELSGSGSIDENAFDILAAEQYPEGQEKLLEFVALTAKANGASVDDLKSRAVGNWSEFIKAFEAWMSKQAPAKKEHANEKEIPPAPEKTAPDPVSASVPEPVSRPAKVAGHQGPPSDAAVWNDFRTRYINLKGPGFSTFVYQNIDLFRHCPKTMQMEAIEKWVKLYPAQPWPLSGSQVTAPETPAPEKTESTLPLSYTPQYKNLMTRKAEFPNEYAAAKKHLGTLPNTVEDCERILSCMMEMVEAQIDGNTGIPDGMPDGYEKF